MLSKLPYKLTGKSNSSFVLIFLHGWPDTFELWTPLIKSLQTDFQCLNVSYPNFATMNKESKWGYDFPIIVDSLKKTIDELNFGNNINKILVAHDWGCIYSYLFDKTYPNYFKSMVSIDVAFRWKVNWKIVSYQWALASAFLMGGFFGNFITHKFLKMLSYNSPWKHLISSHLNYPYYYFWKNILKSKIGLIKPYLGDYKPSFPITYVYGRDKSFHFHDIEYLEFLEKNNGKHVAAPGLHWVMNQNQDLLLELIKERISFIKLKEKTS